MLPSILVAANPTFGASIYARILLLLTGLALACWSISRLRERHLVISISAFFIVTGLGLVLFAAFPIPFDRVSYFLGIHYPPILYMICVILLLMVLIVHLASQLLRLEKRCVRLVQEQAIQGARIDDLERTRRTLGESDRELLEKEPVA
jgi:hypothetical protein